MKIQVYITTVDGNLQAEINGEIAWELYDVIHDLRFGFADSFEVEIEHEDADNWEIVDAIYEQYGNEE